ncbi:hypothetical protein [Sphingobacterium sp. LRF_L2]|uniref:hypothetical protein n=1 Tax=Sphingobacterium sp. LRF_L2 TaxID=3369421 RepID=UPI003F5D9A67
MENFQTPWDFMSEITHLDHEIKFFGLTEITQGAPQIGSLVIDGRHIIGQYGGPVLFEENIMYVPRLFKNILVSGFRIVRINLNTLTTDTIKMKKQPLIWLDQITAGNIYFHTDSEKSILQEVGVNV